MLQSSEMMWYGAYLRCIAVEIEMMQVGFDDATSRYIDAVLDVPELDVLMLYAAH